MCAEQLTEPALLDGGANYVVRNYFEEIDKLIVSPRLRQKAAFAVL